MLSKEEWLKKVSGYKITCDMLETLRRAFGALKSEFVVTHINSNVDLDNKSVYLEIYYIRKTDYGDVHIGSATFNTETQEWRMCQDSGWTITKTEFGIIKDMFDE